MALKKIEPVETPSLKRVLAELNKKHGQNTIGTVDSMETIEISRVPTGIAKLDRDLGGGFPLGQMVELYGIPSAGKSLIAMLTITQAQAMGLECIYFDSEDSFDPAWAVSLGVDIKKLVVCQEAEGEKIFTMMRDLLKAKPGVIVLDSIASITTKQELEGELETQYMAPKARLLSRALPWVNAFNDNTLMIFINQLREVVTALGSRGTNTPGGRSLKHWASIRVKINRDKDLIYKDGKKSGEAIGQILQYNIEKNKTAAPFKVGSVQFYYEGAVIKE